MPGVDPNLVFDGALIWQSFEDGTATMVGALVSATNPAAGFDIEVTFDGYTETPPSGSPTLELYSSAYVSAGGTVDPDTWVYYEDFAGTLIGIGDYVGGEVDVDITGSALQVGDGASGRNMDYGASGSVAFTVVSTPTGLSWSDSSGDFNVDFEECP